MAHVVKWVTYTQFCGIDFYGDESELETDEEIEEEYETLEQAEHEAKKNKYGHRGQFVEVYVDDCYRRDYEL